MNKVCEELRSEHLEIKGNLFAIAGNLWALEKGKRYHQEDLNRIWTSDKTQALEQGTFEPKNEDEKEQQDIFLTISDILRNDTGPFYFFDLHTTSSDSVPFLPVNDSLLNRKFTQQYPVPMVLGIEEYLDGPLLSYINEKGYVSFGFEAGQHDDMASIENHMAFAYVSMVFTGALSNTAVDFERYYCQLEKAAASTKAIYEIYFRYAVKPNEQFGMQPGYKNFQQIEKGQALVESNGQPIVAIHTAYVFMPLYQSQGDDGFFAIRKIRPIFLQLSTLCRLWRLDRLLPLLPGVTWASSKKDSLIVNRKIARFFTKQLLHLLGYRSKKMDKTHLIIKNRERASRTHEYNIAAWMNAK